ncbi:MAG TPA: carboxypeptidase-like regulatory domain-containing protein [Terriglobia bacterium]|nr:carboxypeptidase-like regulatory domain-containing protein [Terriglobia bacterium]
MNRAFFFLPLLLFFFCLLLAAQDTATIMDAVADPSGAMIPGVKVTVSNPDKGFTRELESNSAGEYMAAKVPIGNYVITAGAPGF